MDFICLGLKAVDRNVIDGALDAAFIIKSKIKLARVAEQDEKTNSLQPIAGDKS